MKRLLILAFVFFTVSNISYAAMGTAYDAGSLNQQYVRDMRLHEIQTRSNNRNAIIQKEKTAEQKKIDVPASASTINNIRFSGNQAIPAGDLSRLVSSYIGKSPTDSSISAMRKTIARYYQANGYYSAIVVPETSYLSDGLLVFEIKEGAKNSITIER